MQVDILPSYGVSLGNIYTYASAGLMGRIGFGLPDDFGPARIAPGLLGSDYFLPSENLSGYLHAGAVTRLVARNIFLDGNTFVSSQHVTKNILVADFQCGFELIYKNKRLSYTHVIRTKEFKGQKSPDQFGAAAISFLF